MTRSELVYKIAENLEVETKDVTLIVKEVFDSIKGALANGEICTFDGFGVFELRDRAAREGHNPQDPTKIVMIPAKTVPVFLPDKELVKRISNSDDEYGEEDFLDEEIEEGDDKYDEEDFLSEVFWDEERYDTITMLLERKKNLILQGAPGVGKTFAARRLAYSMMGSRDKSRVMMVQFHQSYSYEDFVMGFRPTKDGFELTHGPFYNFCKAAQDDDQDYFFIIDEINRGNLGKIFGELLMLIEADKRGDELRLMYEDELFSVPPNLYIIGLMNTTDRSLAMIDYALRRRFAFYDLDPAFDSEGFQTMLAEADHPRLVELVDCVKELNENISNDESLGKGFRIGHSYFCRDGEVTDQWLDHVVDYELLPLLQEYWFDEKEKVEFWTGKLRDVLRG